MAKMTKWFPVSVKPVREGWYEYRGVSLRVGHRRRWTGGHWTLYSLHTPYPCVPVSGDEWRGLAQRPDKDE